MNILNLWITAEFRKYFTSDMTGLKGSVKVNILIKRTLYILCGGESNFSKKYYINFIPKSFLLILLVTPLQEQITIFSLYCPISNSCFEEHLLMLMILMKYFPLNLSHLIDKMNIKIHREVLFRVCSFVYLFVNVHNKSKK